MIFSGLFCPTSDWFKKMAKYTDIDSDKFRKGACQAVLELLNEELELAKPDDVAYLEGQAPRIARDIVRRLCSQHGWRESI